ncbi:MAG TPA: hypothetical protein VNQ33_10485, partial [Acidimicrobiales bacterium]|nr:hypothetical protein [Acidimicrobiales bacterium]
MVSSALADRSYRPSSDGFSIEPVAAQLYAAFASVAPSSPVVHCPHCVSTGDLAALAVPPAAVPPETVSRFVRKT